MTGGPDAGMRSRLVQHHRRLDKRAWTNFSLFEVWENIPEGEVRELEGIFRHVFRYDPAALVQNKQRGFKKLKGVRQNDFDQWSKHQ
jgi:hypothetical protein